MSHFRKRLDQIADTSNSPMTNNSTATSSSKTAPCTSTTTRVGEDACTWSKREKTIEDREKERKKIVDKEAELKKQNQIGKDSTCRDSAKASTFLKPTGLSGAAVHASAPDLPSLLLPSSQDMDDLDQPCIAPLTVDQNDFAVMKTNKDECTEADDEIGDEATGRAILGAFTIPSTKFRLSNTNIMKAPEDSSVLAQKKINSNDFPPAPTTSAPPPPSPGPRGKAATQRTPPTQAMSHFDIWQELRKRLSHVINSMERFFESCTVQEKLSHLEDACMGIQNTIEDATVRC